MRRPWLLEDGEAIDNRMQIHARDYRRQQQEPDELDLGAEAVEDLELSEEEGEQVRGGATLTCKCRGRAET
jgi:hypothetical protein